MAEFEEVDLNEQLTDEFVFAQLSDAFVVLENLISGSKNTKDNLERIFELLATIKDIMNDFKDGLISMKNINNIAVGMKQLDDTLKNWTTEEVKMISALNGVLTEQRELKDLITKSNKKRIVEDIENTKPTNENNNMFLYILLISIIIIQIGSFVLKV